MLDVQDHVSADHLSDYLRGDLGGPAEAGIEEHIGSCLVCARRLREEAQLEVLLHEAHERDERDERDGTFECPPIVAPHRRRAWWQRSAATIANTAAAAAALLLVVNPSAPLGSQSNAHAVRHDGASASASALINDALCFPATDASASVTDDNCEEPLTVAMVTDPDDYLSPFDGQLGRGSAIINACLVEDLACEPS